MQKPSPTAPTVVGMAPTATKEVEDKEEELVKAKTAEKRKKGAEAAKEVAEQAAKVAKQEAVSSSPLLLLPPASCR